MENCGLKIVLDEDQSMSSLVKYESNPEKASHHITDILQLIPPSNCNDLVPSVIEQTAELIPNYPTYGDPPIFQDILWLEE